MATTRSSGDVDEQHGRADAQVEGPLHEPVPRAQVGLGDLEEGHAGEVREARAPADQLVVARHHRDVDGVLQPAVDVERLGRELLAGRHQDAMHLELAAELGEVGHPPDRTGVDACRRRRTADQGHAGVLADAEHDAIGRGARAHDQHPGRGQRVQEEAQDHAPTVMTPMVTMTAMTSWVA